MIQLENKQLRVLINPQGAELSSLWHHAHQIDYMWSGDAAFWGKKSPVLFPIVGGLKENTYFFNGKKYTLPRHGFARDYRFEVENATAESATFLLRDTAATREVYPFAFALRLRYALKDNALSLTYAVTNTSAETLYFSIGGHPAFRLPIVPDTTYDDYFLKINKKITAGKYPLSMDGLVEEKSDPFLSDSDEIPLTKALFQSDALVFKHWDVSEIAILSSKTPRSLRMSCPYFPYFGIWSTKNADFVCLEPWCGVADAVNSTQQLTDKEGINALAAGATFERTWEVRVD